MTEVLATRGRERRRPSVRSMAAAGSLAFGVAATGVTTAYLLNAGLWFVAVAMLVALPAFVLVTRVPLSTIALWLLVAPYLLLTSGPARYGFWAVHRALPIVVLVVLVTSRLLGLRSRPLARLGVPELLMVGYLLVSTLSILYRSLDASTSIINLYDRVAVPMCLYLAVRLTRPTEESLRALVPIAAMTVVAQSAIGTIAWVSPGVLPAGWLGRADTRTIGSLGSPSVYGVTVLAAGAFLLHASATERRPAARTALHLLFGLAIVMAVMTFSRGVWLATFVVVAASAVVHPRQLRRVVSLALPLIVVLALTGAASGQLSIISKRFGNEETALSRLPVALASWRMFEEKPVVGWGYDTFDEYDREFQAEVSGFIPEKDHASHNLYLTVLAEQGLVGLLLLLGPAIWLLGRTASAFARLPRTGLASRKLVVLMWAVLGAHVMVNNFSNMRIVFGLGQWWLALGLIAAMVSADTAPERDLPPPLRTSQ